MQRQYPIHPGHESMVAGLRKRPSERIHADIPCKHCKIKSIIGPRYLCSVCPEFNLCSLCIQRIESDQIHPPHHLFYRITFPYPEGQLPPCIQTRNHWSHEVRCFFCGGDIVGYRYLCAQCGFSFCGKCDQIGLHPANHSVIRMLPVSNYQQHTQRSYPVGLQHYPPDMSHVMTSYAPQSSFQNVPLFPGPFSMQHEMPRPLELSTSNWTTYSEESFSANNFQVQNRCSAQDLIKAIGDFGDDLVLNVKGMGIYCSYFISPFALSMTVLLLAHTVKCAPRTEILHSMKLSSFDLDDIYEIARDFIQAMSNSKSVCLHTAFWTSLYPYTSKFKSICMDKFYSSVYSCSSTDTVNSWCCTTSNGRLNRVFDNSAVLPLLTAVSTGICPFYCLHIYVIMCVSM